MKRCRIFILAAVGLAMLSLVPSVEAAHHRDRRGRAAAGTGPRISEEALSIADAYRIDPTAEKLAALKKQVSYDYDVFLKDLRAKIKGNKQDLKNQDAYRRFESWARDRDKNIDEIVRRLIKSREDRANGGAATDPDPQKNTTDR